MARRTLATLADIIEDRFDKDQADTTFDAFVQSMLNLTMQEIASEIPWARWLMDEASLTATVSGTQYIVMPTDMDIDSMVSIRDETNNRKVIRISPEMADQIDPGRDLTGDEIFWWYQRVETTGSAYEDRIYFLYEPDSADTLTVWYGIIGVTVSSGSLILPEKWEWVLIEGAMEKCWDRVDPTNTAAKRLCRETFERGRALIRQAANTAPGESQVMQNHRPFMNRTTGVHGPSYPANFDITP